MFMDFQDDIILEDLPDKYRWIVDVIGMTAFRNLCRMSGGSTLYIPMIKELAIHARNRHIVSDFTGKNHVQLAIKYGLCLNTIYVIVKGAKGGK